MVQREVESRAPRVVLVPAIAAVDVDVRVADRTCGRRGGKWTAAAAQVVHRSIPLYPPAHTQYLIVRMPAPSVKCALFLTSANRVPRFLVVVLIRPFPVQVPLLSHAASLGGVHVRAVGCVEPACAVCPVRRPCCLAVPTGVVGHRPCAAAGALDQQAAAAAGSATHAHCTRGRGCHACATAVAVHCV